MVKGVYLVWSQSQEEASSSSHFGMMLTASFLEMFFTKLRKFSYILIFQRVFIMYECGILSNALSAFIVVM